MQKRQHPSSHSSAGSKSTIPSSRPRGRSSNSSLTVPTRLLDDPSHSDLTVTVGPHSFHVHKAILSLRTSFFTNATNPSSGFTESKANVVTIEEHSPHAVWRFLKYCYTGDYPEVSTLDGESGDDPSPLRHTRVYALADMLDVPSLKTVATAKLKRKLDTDIVSADFHETVRDAYSSTYPGDKELRNVLVHATRKHLGDLVHHEEFRKLLLELAEFSGQLVIESANVERPVCPTCKRCECGKGPIHNFCSMCNKNVDLVPGLQCTTCALCKMDTVEHFCSGCLRWLS
ncbi:BTB/POZ protein [Sphaerosporella brunnea]|uniref:BTB/POZ protein n=1 Tax=Sphaerosporella brunnea TaxID=1250544 RepID=A0A5J5EDG0_9PEZI|nr:BTB/POZ protein [Sphaerosporella brunnea]